MVQSHSWAVGWYVIDAVDSYRQLNRQGFVLRIILTHSQLAVHDAADILLFITHTWTHFLHDLQVSIGGHDAWPAQLKVEGNNHTSIQHGTPNSLRDPNRLGHCAH